MKELWGYVKKYKAYVIIGPFFKFLEAILELLNPMLMARIIDIGIKNSDKPYIIKYTLLLLLFNIVGFSCALVCQKCASVASTNIAKEIRYDMYKRINEYSIDEIDKFGTSTLLTRLTNDVNRIRSLISSLMRVVSRTPFLLIGSLILSILINVKLSLIFCVILPIIIFILVIFTKKTLPYFKKLREKLDNVTKITRENLNGVRVIRAFNHQDEEEHRFDDANHSFTQDSIHVSKITSFLNPFIFLIVDFAIMAALYFGAIQVNVNGLTQGELLAFCNYFTTISIALVQISKIYINIVNSSASYHRISEVLNTELSITYSNNDDIKIRKYKNKPILEFKKVGFAFDNKEKDINRMFLKNVSLKIMPHTSLGIIGPTGSGKSTLVNLMLRFYDCNSGKIELYGRDIKEYSEKQLREIISVTSQRANLFSGSLRSNMQLRKPNATDREITKALQIAQAWEFVKDWPNKFDYNIMAGGKNVSGGQKQRLTIARSLIGDFDMLILDDSASALDFMTDLRLRKALKKELDSAIVLVSQRVTTIKNCDLIIVMDQGDIVGMGKHSQLLKTCELYKNTYKSQTEREE